MTGGLRRLPLVALLLLVTASAVAACGKAGKPVLPEGRTDSFPAQYPKSTEPQEGLFD